MTSTRIPAISQRSSILAENIYQHSQRLILAFLFIAAFAVRLYRVNEPPLNFHATRQYRSMIIARGVYFASAKSIPEQAKQIALISKERQGILEPPIMENLVAAGYQLLGGELLWLPHVLSSLFWLIGGFFLYGIGKHIADPQAAIVAVAIYLFLPFAVVASRSFQPDPLMIMLQLAGLWSILRFYERLSTPRLAATILISAAAFAVKPASLFILVGAFLALSISQHGVRKGLFSKHVLLFLVFTMMPTLAIYAIGAFTGTFLIGEAQKTVIPSLLVTPFFWQGWLGNISITVGYTAFLAALLGVFLFHPGLPRSMMLGMWAGYVAFCLALNYNVATHDYYQLQLIPLVALSLGQLVVMVLRQVFALDNEWRTRSAARTVTRSALAGIFAMAFLLSLGSAVLRLSGPDPGKTVRIEEEIGELVSHSTRTIFLASDYGVSLEYHGLLSGEPWPLASDLEWERLAGTAEQTAGSRYQSLFAGASPEYFIVLNQEEYNRQPDLKEFLNENFPILVQSEDYLIFDLKHQQGSPDGLITD